ncbi:hypothetical protein [Streptococcus pluranimalium]|uniref:hypothetical protein n=1 Tax=Streptococcus pluranimalium TaxID=82348 RepID=UPI003F6924C1
MAELNQTIEEEPVKGQDTRNVKRRKLKKVLRKVYECYHSTFDGRNSFSKTDTDATFMRMKDDPMRNGQLKAGYNLQRIWIIGFMMTSVIPIHILMVGIIILTISTIAEQPLDLNRKSRFIRRIILI